MGDGLEEGVLTFHGVQVSWFLCSAGGYWDPPTPTAALRLRVHCVRDSAKCESDSFVISLLSPFASTLPAAGNFRCKQKSRSRRSDDGTGSKDIRYVRYGLGVQRSSGERPTLLAWPRRDPMMLAIWPTSGEKYVGKPRKSSEWRVTARCSGGAARVDSEPSGYAAAVPGSFARFSPPCLVVRRTSSVRSVRK